MAGSQADVAIVGGGLAGAAAADLLGRFGARVVVLDDNARLGGQYLRGGRHAGGSWDPLRRRGLNLIEQLPRTGVDIRPGAEVIGIEPGFELLVSQAGALSTVRCERLLLATGARERFIPFPGWTLPGVLSTGATQILIKQSGVLPARRTLVGGAGLFLNAVAGDLLAQGGIVSAVVDEAGLHTGLPSRGLVAAQWRKFAEGGMLLARLLAAGTPLYPATRILAARGRDAVDEVVTARVDRHGAILPGTERSHRVGSLAVGFGFTANIEAARLAGCEVVHNEALGGWVVRVGEDLETSVPGIHAAGEITAIGGAAKSWTEGRLAGHALLRRAGFPKAEAMRAEIAALRRARRGQMAFARYFNSRTVFQPDYMARWIGGLGDEVPLCRCESVTLGAVRRAVADGTTTPAGVKKATRCGMGICQGSTCGSVLVEVLAALTGRPQSQVPLPSVRMPLKPVYLGTLAGESMDVPG
jgi:NADPH-dependent 2,4-dienoyl-CoA reductase/sulfur reductase-like enzyme